MPREAIDVREKQCVHAAIEQELALGAGAISSVSFGGEAISMEARYLSAI